MQSVICLLKKRLECKEDRKDFQKIFLRHVRHADCREMKMTVWTLRYVIAEFLEIKITEKTLKELAAVLTELGFVDRNTRLSLTEFLENVIETKPQKSVPRGKRSLNIPILTQRSSKKKSTSDVLTPRGTGGIILKPKSGDSEMGHKFSKKHRSVSLTRPLPVQVKTFTRHGNMKSIKAIKASKEQMTSTNVYQQPVNNTNSNALPPQSGVNEMIRRQRSSNSANSTPNLNESIKMIETNFKQLTVENCNLQKEIAKIQAEICEVQKSNNLMRDLTQRLKQKYTDEKHRLDENMRVLVRTLMDMREIYAASHHSISSQDTPKQVVEKVDVGTTSLSSIVPPLMLLMDSNSQTED